MKKGKGKNIKMKNDESVEKVKRRGKTVKKK